MYLGGGAFDPARQGRSKPLSQQQHTRTPYVSQPQSDLSESSSILPFADIAPPSYNDLAPLARQALSNFHMTHHTKSSGLHRTNTSSSNEGGTASSSGRLPSKDIVSQRTPATSPRVPESYLSERSSELSPDESTETEISLSDAETRVLITNEPRSGIYNTHSDSGHSTTPTNGQLNTEESPPTLPATRSSSGGYSVSQNHPGTKRQVSLAGRLLRGMCFCIYFKPCRRRSSSSHGLLGDDDVSNTEPLCSPSTKAALKEKILFAIATGLGSILFMVLYQSLLAVLETLPSLAVADSHISAGRGPPGLISSATLDPVSIAGETTTDAAYISALSDNSTVTLPANLPTEPLQPSSAEPLAIKQETSDSDDDWAAGTSSSSVAGEDENAGDKSYADSQPSMSDLSSGDTDAEVIQNGDESIPNPNANQQPQSTSMLIFLSAYIIAYLASIFWQHALNYALVPALASNAFCDGLVHSYVVYSTSLGIVICASLVIVAVFKCTPQTAALVLIPVSGGVNYYALTHWPSIVVHLRAIGHRLRSLCSPNITSLFRRGPETKSRSHTSFVGSLTSGKPGSGPNSPVAVDYRSNPHLAVVAAAIAAAGVPTYRTTTAAAEL